MKSASVLALLLLVGATLTAANAEVVLLTDATYAAKLKEQPNTLWFVNFHASWCPWSQRLAPAWEQLATALEGHTGVEVGSVDCSTSGATCIQAAIQAYPTLKAFYNGEEVSTYYGDRDWESLKAFVLYEHAHQLAKAAKLITTEEAGVASSPRAQSKDYYSTAALKLKSLFGGIDSWLDSLDAFNSRV